MDGMEWNGDMYIERKNTYILINEVVINYFTQIIHVISLVIVDEYQVSRRTIDVNCK